MTDPLIDDYLQTAIAAAREAGALIRDAFHNRTLRGTVDFKTSAADVVTATDRAVEALVFGLLRARFPTHRFIGEETADENPALTDELTWIVDPVDGTTNFVHGFPFVAVSIALVRSRAPLVGVVFNPILDELFAAALGKGSTLNGVPLPLHPPVHLPSLATALLATEYGYDRDDKMDAKLKGIRGALVSPARGIRSIGSAALEACYVARGALDAYWEAGVHAWDVAAACLVVTESGGAAVNYFPNNDPHGFETSDATTERVDLQSRQFLFVRAMPDGPEGVNRIVREVRRCLEPLEYPRD
ncbi:Inositol monophosphatase 2 [Phlyctochytrium bullatum]|nr:Inositol monophosphatase 2 [Phlyctochytrium bullatum]